VNGEVHGGRPTPTGAVVPRKKKSSGHSPELVFPLSKCFGVVLSALGYGEMGGGNTQSQVQQRAAQRTLQTVQEIFHRQGLWKFGGTVLPIFSRGQNTQNCNWVYHWTSHHFAAKLHVHNELILLFDDRSNTGNMGSNTSPGRDFRSSAIICLMFDLPWLGGEAFRIGRSSVPGVVPIVQISYN
jgi:hypothetical protein